MSKQVKKNVSAKEYVEILKELLKLQEVVIHILEKENAQLKNKLKEEQTFH